MAEPVMDVRMSAALLRQRWRYLARAGAVGLVLGLLYIVLVPAQLSSTSLILFPGASGSRQDGVIATQATIVLSTPVLTRAGEAVTPALSAADVRNMIKVDSPTTKLIKIQAFSRRAREARGVAQAVADSYLATMQANIRSVTSVTLSDLRSREAALAEQLKVMQGEIQATAQRQRGGDATSYAGRRDAQLLAQLTAEQGNVSLQLDKVKEEIAAQGAMGGAFTEASIIQPASPPSGTGLVQRLLTVPFTTGILTAAGAALLLLVRVARDPRLRTRDDLADAVGSSVLADVRSRPQACVAEWLAFFETYEASAVEAWAFRQLLRGLVMPKDAGGAGKAGAKRGPGRVDHPRSIGLITFAGDPRSAAVGPQLAIFAASLGVSTRFVITSGRQDAAALWAACLSDRGSGLRAGLVVAARGYPETAGQAFSANAQTLDEIPPGSVTNPDARTSATAAKRDAQQMYASKEIMARIGRILGKRPDFGDARDEEGSETWTTEVSGGASNAPDGERATHYELTTSKAEPSDQPSVEPQADPKRRWADLTITLAVVDRRQPSLQGVPNTAVTIAAISPGVATREELARLAVAVDDGGRRIDGLVIADPDPSDCTTGRRTLDERARQAPLPLRVTGMAQSAVPVTDRGTHR